MTFDEYLNAVEYAVGEIPRWRLGQAAFNVLWEHRVDLSERVRGTRLDPYHDNDKLPEFYKWVEENWPSTQDTGTASGLSTT